MIFYFSGTGNSKYIAEQLSKILDDELFSINDSLKDTFSTNTATSIRFISYVPYVFVVPTYAWRLPKIVKNFILNLKFSENQNVYFIQTCGSEVGNSSHYAKILCRSKGLNFMGLAAIVMPENYLAMFDTPDKNESRKIISNAINKIPSIAEAIANNKTLTVDPKLAKHGVLSHIANPIFYPLFVKSKKFKANEKCISCGKCVKVCPLNNIKLQLEADSPNTDENLPQGKRPVWGKNCTHCMACILYCPTEAIEYEKSSISRYRYNLENTLDHS